MNNTIPNNSLSRKFSLRDDKKSEYFHSSNYGIAQSGANIGTASSSGSTVAERKNLEMNRRYTTNYRNAQLTTESFKISHAANGKAMQYDPSANGAPDYAAIAHGNASAGQSEAKTAASSVGGGYQSPLADNGPARVAGYANDRNSTAGARATSSDGRRTYLNTGQTTGGSGTRFSPNFNPTQKSNSFMNKNIGNARSAGAGASGAIGFGGKK